MDTEYVPSESYHLEPAHILSLDGGRIRGMLALMIPRSIMNKIGDHKKTVGGTLKSSHYFDPIYGTSTGGLIAIFLGRLKIGTQEAIEAYYLEGEGAIIIGVRFRKLEDAVKEVMEKDCGGR